MKLSNRLGAFWVLNLSLIPTALAAATCNQLSGRVYTGPNSRNFDILCDTSTINGNIFAYYSVGDEFQDCVDRCDSIGICLVALYLAGSGDCALINSYQGTRSFNGNDVAVVRAAPIPTTTSAESTSAEVSTSETTTTETTTIEATSSQAMTVEPSTNESSTVGPSSVETTPAETSGAESSTIEPSSAETTSSDATSTEATETESSTIDSSTAGPQSTESSSTETTSVEPSSTSPESTLVITTDLPYTSAATTETSTDDCEDETSYYEMPTTAINSTSTGSESHIQSTTSSDPSLSASTAVPQSSELSTSSSSDIPGLSSQSASTATATDPSVSTSLSTSVTSQEVPSLPASLTSTVTQIYTTDGEVTSLTSSSPAESEEAGSTNSVSGVTIMETTFESQLPTYLPASDCVWTVYLTMVRYVTCSTGVVPETSTTATYVTVDGNGGSYKPPVVQLPDGCIGGYQVDASGNSYPVVQPTMGSHGMPSGDGSHPSARPTPASPGGSQPSFVNGQYHVPAPTAGFQGPPLPEQGTGKPPIQPAQGSQGKSSGSKSQPPVSGQDSPEPSGGEPHRIQGEVAPTAISAYQTGTPAYPSTSSPIHQGQHNTTMILTIKTTTTGGGQEHSASSSSSAEAPSTPVIASGSNRHQSMLWTSIAGALLVLSVLSA